MRKILKTILLIILCTGVILLGFTIKYLYFSETSENNTISDNEETPSETVDVINPEIVLDGEEVVNIYQGEDYVEPGFKAFDEVDGNLTDTVNVTNDIDNTVSGIYTVVYQVSDSSGNSVEATRTVKVRNDPNAETDESVRGLPVLMYHWFYDAGAGETGANGNWMEISELREQMQYLSDNDYYFPTWEEVYDFIDGVITLPEKSVVLTFDDGHESFFRLAVPIIEEYGINVTSFLITSEITSEFVQENASDNVIFRSHSHDMHRAGSDGNGRFLTMTYDEACEDLNTSADILGAGFVFCYPYGHYSEFTKEVLSDCGYKLAFTTEYGRVYPNMDKLALPRVRMSAEEGLNSFKSKVS